ncbi:MAG: trigger factor [Flavobacteriaceae bacterium]|nr:MAG: trigger factor [Flavobacteriaceae bacterium]
MNIVKNQIDALNAKLEVTISQEDFKPEVEKELKAYRKNANIPGFRKGQVPMGLIQKQYEKPLVIEKVNTLIQRSINDFLNQEKLAVLGNPLPVVNPEKPLDWDAKELNFTFELGLAPEISVDLSKAKVDKYELEIDPKQIDTQIESLQKRFGENTVISQVEADSNLTVSIAEISDNQDAFFKEAAMLSMDKITDAARAQFIGKSQGEKVRVSTLGLFTAKTDLSYLLGKSINELDALSEELEFVIQSIVKIIPAPLDQDLFDKVYGKDAVDSAEAFRSKIEEESKEVYKAEMDKYFLNQAIEEVINVTPFELPEEFLLRWIQDKLKLGKRN